MILSKDTASKGFALLELVVVVAVIGVLTSVAMPNYLSYKVETKTTACQANRRNIEAAENAYYIQNNSPGLTIPGSYTCPSGGTYVWLVSNPEDSRYPRTGCSVHYGDPAPEPDRAGTGGGAPSRAPRTALSRSRALLTRARPIQSDSESDVATRDRRTAAVLPIGLSPSAPVRTA